MIRGASSRRACRRNGIDVRALCPLRASQPRRHPRANRHRRRPCERARAPAPVTPRESSPITLLPWTARDGQCADGQILARASPVHAQVTTGRWERSRAPEAEQAGGGSCQRGMIHRCHLDEWHQLAVGWAGRVHACARRTTYASRASRAGPQAGRSNTRSNMGWPDKAALSRCGAGRKPY